MTAHTSLHFCPKCAEGGTCEVRDFPGQKKLREKSCKAYFVSLTRALGSLVLRLKEVVHTGKSL